MALTDDIIGRLGRQHSTAAVLFHHAVAEHLGLGSTDHKCFDLLRERGPSTGSALATLTGLTTGAITGVVARLEKAGYVERRPHPTDGRQQIISPVKGRLEEFHALFTPIREDMAALLAHFDKRQLAAIAGFLEGGTAIIYRHIALLGNMHVNEARDSGYVRAAPGSSRPPSRKVPPAQRPSKAAAAKGALQRARKGK